jgi:hypothetical protein
MTEMVELSYGGGYPAARGDYLTHRIFRYPAKFHPPVVRELLNRYTREHDLVLDPFVGGGTLLVEARTLGRSSLGVDVDPVAVLVAKAKSHRYQPQRLAHSATALQGALHEYRRSEGEYDKRKFEDLSEREYESAQSSVYEWIPPIPNLFHWFRRYVIIDLAHIRRAIATSDMPLTHKVLFTVIFGSIVRNASNADPVPVSGLEFTAHMRRRDGAGRLVDPFVLLDKAISRTLVATASFWAKSSPTATVDVLHGDSTQIADFLHTPVDAVITSPPYHGAVDYYRRHQLEMYWMGLIDNHATRQELLQKYIGRPKVAQSHPLVSDAPLRTALAKEWENRIRQVSNVRADAFHHYIAAMTGVFDGLARCTQYNTPLILVVGHSSWNDAQIPTTQLFEEIADDRFRLERVMTYMVKNRYMSYTRHNGANIDREYVLEFRRR